MIILKITYSDKTEVIKHFRTQEEADWYTNNEGDHLIKKELECVQTKSKKK